MRMLQQREFYLMLCDELNNKEVQKGGDVYISADSHCYILQTNTALKSNHIPMKLFKKSQKKNARIKIFINQITFKYQGVIHIFVCVNIHIYIHICLSLVAQMIKLLSAMRETQVQCLGWEDLLEKEIATHSYILAWKIPSIEELGGLQFLGSQRVLCY